MSGRGKGQTPSVPTRRSTRERKQHSFGSDFEQDDPALGSAPKPKPARKTTPGKAPGKGVKSTPDPQPVPDPTPVPVPDPDPVPKGKVTWPSDVDHWKKPTLPRNHSKRPHFIQKRL